MANPNTPPSGNKSEVKLSELKDIKPLDLKKLGGMRERIKHVLVHGLKALGFAGLIGYGAGDYVQGGYREMTQYSGDPEHPVLITEEEQKAKEEAEAKAKGEVKPEAAEEEEKGWLGKTWDSFKSAGKAGMAETGAYKNVKGKMEEFNQFKIKMLEMGDDISFWGPFCAAFLAAALAINRFLKFLNNEDPIQQAKNAAIEKKMNTIINRLNILSKQAVLSQSEIAEIKKMAEEFDGLTKDL